MLWPVAAKDPSNGEIADAFAELGTLYELDGAISYRVLAYRDAAKVIRQSPVSIAELTRAGRVTELPGIGKTIAEKIQALLDTGSIPSAERLREALREHPASNAVEVAGSARRLAETCKDIDLIATASDGKALAQ